MRKRRKTKIAAGIMAAIMLTNVFYTQVPTYAVKNDSEMEQETIVQTEESKELDCPLEIHKHDQSCYDAKHELICGQADFVVHTHDANCYDSDGTLACTLPEKKLHTHGSSCYVETTSLVCGQKDASEHKHTDDCYQTTQVLSCDREETAGHTHSAKCYEHVLICTVPESAGHTHSESCYHVTEDRQLTCDREEEDGHHHDDSCYAVTKESELTCDREEREEHHHSDSCYTVTKEKELTCDQEETDEEDGHHHDDSCHTEIEHSELTCGQEEEDGHHHDDSCYTVTEHRDLICAQEERDGHHHDDSCYTITEHRDLACGQKETAGHTHSEACYYQDKLICGQEEMAGHTHKKKCYAEEKTLICSPHTHTDACRETTRTVTCSKEEIELHKHQSSCYDKNKNLICGKLETQEHQHTDACFRTTTVSVTKDVESLVIETETESLAAVETELASEGENETEFPAESETETQSTAESETETVADTEFVTETRTESFAAEETELVSEVENETEFAAETETENEPQSTAPAESETETAAETELVTETETESLADAETELASEAETEIATELETETETETEEFLTTLDTEISQNLSLAIAEAVREDAELWTVLMSAMYSRDEEVIAQLAEQFEVEPEIMQLYLQSLGDTFGILYDALGEDEDGSLWDALMDAQEDEDQLAKLAESLGVDAELLLLFIQYGMTDHESDETAELVDAYSGEYDFYTVNGSVAFSLNPGLTKKETQGVTYTLKLENPNNDYETVQTYCSNAYNDGWPNYNWYTAGAVLWCVNRYNEDWANIGVSSYGIPASQKWEGLRQAIQYAVWYFSSSRTLNQNSSDPVERLAFDIKKSAWDNSATTGGDGRIYWFQSDDPEAPNLVSFAYSGATASTYIATEATYVTEIGSINGYGLAKGARVIQNSGEQQLGYCYDPDNAAPSGQGYTYIGNLNDDTIRKILYNGYPYNKALLHNSGLSAHELYWQTQQAIAYKRKGNGGSGPLYDLLVQGYGTGQVGNVTLTIQDPPKSFVVARYHYLTNYQDIIVPDEPMLITVSGTKIWVGDDEETRPETVSMQLYKRVGEVERPVMKNGVLLTFEAKQSESWSYRFSNLPRYENGEKIEYFVKELEVPEGYTKSENGMNVTNTWQVEDGTLTVSKTVTGDTAPDVDFTFEAVFQNADDTAYQSEIVWIRSKIGEDDTTVSTKPDGNGKVTLTLKQDESVTATLPAGIKYEITETDIPEAFTQTSPAKTEDNPTGSATGTIKSEADAKAAFTNAYSKPVSLTLSKTVEGYNADTNQAFTFKLTLKDSSEAALANKSYPVLSSAITDVTAPAITSVTLDEKGETTISLKHGQSVMLYNLPAGYRYTIEESDPDALGYQAKTRTVVDGTEGNYVDGALVSGASSADNAADVEVKYFNTKKRQTYEIDLSKTVRGQFGDLNKPFTFEITLKYEQGNAVSGDFEVETSSINGVAQPEITDNRLTFTGGTARVSLKHGQSIRILAVPEGYMYEIREVLEEGSVYETDINVTSGTADPLTISKNTDTGEQQLTENVTVEYTNTMPEIVPTGINTNVAQHAMFLMLMVLLAGLTVIFRATSRREKEV